MKSLVLFAIQIKITKKYAFIFYTCKILTSSTIPRHVKMIMSGEMYRYAQRNMKAAKKSMKSKNKAEGN
jgi:undecaprenyl pyrophosphate synthase